MIHIYLQLAGSQIGVFAGTTVGLMQTHLQLISVHVGLFGGHSTFSHLQEHVLGSQVGREAGHESGFGHIHKQAFLYHVGVESGHFTGSMHSHMHVLGRQILFGPVQNFCAMKQSVREGNVKVSWFFRTVP